MRARRVLRWLRYKGSAPLLVIIVVLSVAAITMARGRDATRPLALAAMALLGIALVLGCLFAFPYADIWKDSREPGVPGPADSTAKEKDRSTPDFVNDIRTMLISTVVGAFGLVTLYLTYESAHAAVESVKAAQRQQTSGEQSTAGALMDSHNDGVRTAGLLEFQRMIHERTVAPADGYRVIAYYVRSRATWEDAKHKDWLDASDASRLAQEESPTVGVGSLTKRAPDVQIALNVLGEPKPAPFPADLRDADLQGVAIGRSQLVGTIFDGAHLDYLDCRTGGGKPPYADLRTAGFQGASLFGAYFNNADLSGARFNTPVSNGQIRRSQVTLLRYAHLRRVTATGASFAAADLTAADLRDATLREVNFSGATLRWARLEGADLTGARLDGAKLYGATYDAATRWPGGVVLPPGGGVIERDEVAAAG